MKRINSLMILFFLVGCATVEPGAPSLTVHKLTKEDQIQVGMTTSEVANIMGDHLVIGYDQTEDPVEPFKPVLLKNPVRSEILRSDTKTFDIAFYYTLVKVADGTISDDELTPLVFQNDQFLGRGWDFLEKIKQENSL